MNPSSEQALHLLRLTLIPGLGPVLIRRLLAHFGTPDAVLAATPSALEAVQDIGPARAQAIVRHREKSLESAMAEIELARSLGVRILTLGSDEYHPLLAVISDPPPVLYVRGALDPAAGDRFPVAIVGSRKCTAYGIEQAERFAGVLARSCLSVVSGGARGIDAAAHRGALRAGGRTIVVQGCGLAHTYPPEHADLFNTIAPKDDLLNPPGAIISELPLNTPPAKENFPRRNRIVAGLALGVLIIEAGDQSGALITARIAAEELGREVMVLPGRVDSAASKGALDLIKQGGGLLVTDPADVIHVLETAARHADGGTFTDRYMPQETAPALFEDKLTVGVSPTQATILAALTGPASLDQLLATTGLTPQELRAELTVLEIQKRVVRRGGLLERSR